MKKIIYTLLAAVAATAFTSCEDALERLPKDSMNPDNYFTSAEALELFTNDFYTMFPIAGLYNETADVIAKTTLTDEVNGTRIVEATSSSWTWTRLRDINFYLQHSPDCEDEAARAEYDGVARFFRAYFYFDKVRHYGDVPWVDTPLADDSPELYKGRDPRETVMRHVLEDLDYAIDNLPSAKNVYRVTRWTAMALKSRACLFEGTFRKYHGLDGGERYLEECADVSRRFISESGYSIYNSGETPYKTLFSSLTANSTEIILARAFSTSLKIYHEVGNYLTSATYGRPGLLKDIVNMYLMEDGSRFTDIAGYEKMSFAEEMKGRDRRLSQTIRYPGYTRDGQTAVLAPNLNQSITGYQLTKYLGDPKYDTYNTSVNDLPIFRTAEVYLNFAEALAELGQLTQSDLDISVNKLRTRGGVPSLKMVEANGDPDPYLLSAETGYPNVTKSENTGVILEIRRERTVELLMEGLRYWDIMRWKEGKRFERQFTGLYFPGEGSYDLDGNGTNDVCIYTSSKPYQDDNVVFLRLGRDIELTEGSAGGYVLTNSGYTRRWNEERDYLYPIPTDDRVLTNGAITQNPGWEDNLGL